MARPRPSRRTVALSTAGVAVVAVVGVFLTTTGDDDVASAPTGSSASSSTSTDAASASPSSSPTEAPPSPAPTDGPAAPPAGEGPPPTEPGGGDDTAAPSIGVTTLPPVAVGEGAELGTGLRATVLGVDQVEVTARGPGEVAGTALAARIEMRNGTDAPLRLDGISVTATTEGGVPAVPSDGDPARPFAGELAPGDVAVGTYVFRPEGSGASLRLEVSSDQAAEVVVVQR